ncbi:alpha-1,3-mannosyl-glycoprotein 4-beta-N-acetylglucosaminyltransferase-like protein MGAT4D [Orycteropus afer afer]|uniref:Alpha-1,3-mannosyl-glycoprotein 4-beta-N-acetylglucosaminyltransferase-like protein MGAT4D n=1 Tax=Orycteropus afer afer TaxID=1230840 RepID=A0A8B6ZUQ6_ORYAF|nr:alpha-1,3-mannosyl-glycoprotein 4-beta-N-acetylglucosaminyltransferase-like protein MGAT4D [Orycteropus afer afer]
MRTKHVNLLIALVAITLFTFSCFCVSRMAQTSNQLINCKNHILEFKENMQRLKNKTENNSQEMMKLFKKMKNDIIQREDLSGSLGVEKTVDTLGKNETLSDAFEDLKLFLPHLRKAGRIYPDVIIGKGRTGVSFAVGISTVSRGEYSYLKQTLTSVISRMTLSEERESVVIVSVADSNEEYLNSVVNMVKKKFKRQVMSGSLEVISIPTFFYPNMLNDKQSTEESQNHKSWEVKQALDFCFLMLYAKPKAIYYLQLEDDIITKYMYFTKITNFVHNITTNNWFYIEFSILGFIGKLFHSEDLPDFVRFFLMFYKDKPIDMLLGDIFQIKYCKPRETFKECLKRNKQVRIRYKPSLFQHVGIHSSFPGREQYYKKNKHEDDKHNLKKLGDTLVTCITLISNDIFQKLF